MKMLEIGGLAAALVIAAGMGSAFAPVAHGQSAAPRARTYQVFGGGSEIGVSIRDVDGADTKSARGTQGVLVEDVLADSPAAAAGIKKGDVVTEFDGERVRSVRQFTRLVAETPAGRKVTAAVMRDGQRLTVSVEPRASEGFRGLNMPNLRVLGDFDRDFELAVPPAPPAPPTPPAPPAPPALPGFDTFLWRSGNTLGVTIQDVSPQLAEYFGAKDGVLVTSVAEDSAAAKAGLKAGDVITSLNGSTIESTSDLRRNIQRLEGGAEFTLDVMRDKKTVTLKGKMDERNRRTTFRSIV